VNRFIIMTTAALVVALSIAGQEQLRVDVRLVNITATVKDANGVFVKQLRQEDFIVEEDGVPQRITHFSQDLAVPVSVGILLDTSGSMSFRMKSATDAVMRFTRNIHKDDVIFLMTFAGGTVLRQDFTSDRSLIARALRSLNQPNDRFNVVLDAITALNDALKIAIEKVHQGRHIKRAILLVSDGQDTWSKTTADELSNTMRRSDVLIYSLGVGDPIPSNSPNAASLRGAVNIAGLNKYADITGGSATLIKDERSNHLNAVLSGIEEELRNQYSLAYYRTTPDDGRFHTIRVRTRDGLVARTRSGYLAPQN